MTKIFPMLFCLLLTVPSIARADTIVLKSGKILEGEMVDYSDEDVTLERGKRPGGIDEVKSQSSIF